MTGIEIAALAPADRTEWMVLAREYKNFYRTVLADADYERAWRMLLADERVQGLGARLEGRLVGIAHFLFHAADLVAELLLPPRFVHGRGRARAGRRRGAD